MAQQVLAFERMDPLRDLFLIDNKLFYLDKLTGHFFPLSNEAELKWKEWTNISDQIQWGLHSCWAEGSDNGTDIGDGEIIANSTNIAGTLFFNLKLVWGHTTTIKSSSGAGWEFKLPLDLMPNQFAYHAGIRNILTGHIYRPGSSGGRFLISAMWSQPGTNPANAVLAVYGMGSQNGRLERLSAEWPIEFVPGSYMALSTGPWELNLPE